MNSSFVRRARVSKKSASACRAAGAFTMIGKAAGVLVLTECASETAAVSRVIRGTQGAQHLQQSHPVFVGNFLERDPDAETWIAHAHFPLHVSSYPVQLELQVHIRAYREGRHQFHLAAMLADVGQRAPSADVAALHPKLCAARTFVAWTLPAFAAPCCRGCRRASFWLREPGGMLVRLQPPKIVRTTAVGTHRILSQLPVLC